MELTRQLFRLMLLGAINHQVTHIIVAGSIFADLRERMEQMHPKLGMLVRCHLCFGTWVGFLLALIFRPRFLETGSSRLPLQRPSTTQQIVAFFADAFAISLAGRFYTELLAILAGQAAVKQEQRELLEEQVEQVKESTSNGTTAGEPVSRPS
jgi:hypothetical protein